MAALPEEEHRTAPQHPHHHLLHHKHHHDHERHAALEEKWVDLSDGMKDHKVHHSLVKAAEAEDTVEPSTIKERVGAFLSNWKFEVFIVTLVLLDLIFTVIECGLDYHVFCVTPELIHVGRDEIRSLDRTGAEAVAYFGEDMSHNNSNQNMRVINSSFLDLWDPRQNEIVRQTVRGAAMLQVSKSTLYAFDLHRSNQPEGGGNGASDEGEAGASDEGEAGAHESTLTCEGPHGERTLRLEHACHVASVTILLIFLVELAAKAWVNLEHFVGSKLHLVDLVVVAISFLVDVTWPIIRSRNAELGELQADVMKVPLLLIRLWRVVRICHGSSEMVNHGLEYVQELKGQIQFKDDEIEKLKAALSSLLKEEEAAKAKLARSQTTRQ